MPAKNVESLRQKECRTQVVRLLRTKPFIDDKWVTDRTKLKEYLVVKYPKSDDRLIPIWNYTDEGKVIWWDASTNNELKTSIVGYDANWERERKDTSKLSYCREEFNSSITESFNTDDFAEADLKYVEWCKADGVALSRFQLGRVNDDDK